MFTNMYRDVADQNFRTTQHAIQCRCNA